MLLAYIQAELTQGVGSRFLVLVIAFHVKAIFVPGKVEMKMRSDYHKVHE